jgi:hypothetical protein
MTPDTSPQLPGDLDTAVRAELEAWRAGNERGRRALRVHLGSNVKADLARRRRAIEA